MKKLLTIVAVLGLAAGCDNKDSKEKTGTSKPTATPASKTPEKAPEKAAEPVKKPVTEASLVEDYKRGLMKISACVAEGSQPSDAGKCFADLDAADTAWRAWQKDTKKSFEDMIPLWKKIAAIHVDALNSDSPALIAKALQQMKELQDYSEGAENPALIKLMTHKDAEIQTHACARSKHSTDKAVSAAFKKKCK